MNGVVPGYIHEIFKPSLCKYSKRSQMAMDLPLQKTKTGQKSLSFLGPKIWSKIGPSLFHMEISASATKSSHQDCRPCYLPLPFFSYTYTLLFCWKIKSCCDHIFPQQIRAQTFVQWYIYYKNILVWRLLSWF